MPTIYGKKYYKEDFLKRISRIQHFFYNKFFQLEEGREKGVRGIDIRNPSGLNFIVLTDRGMDIPYASYKGILIGWNSLNEYVHPAFYEPEKDEWLRGYFGGLLTTCGLTYLGAPNNDLGEELGLHGRYSYLPAERVNISERWINDNFVLEINGRIRETKVFGPNIVLRRKIMNTMGEKRIIIKDKVKNEGWYKQPLMILYHINIGFPILDNDSYLVSTSIAVAPRDTEALYGINEFNLFHSPQKGYREKVYFHEMATDDKGYAYAAIINEKLYDGTGVYVKFSKNTLDRFIQWKMLGEGLYVVGLEPSNSFVMGRSWERAKGTLKYINSQEEINFFVEIGVLDGPEEIQRFKRMISKIKEKYTFKLYDNLDDFLRKYS